MSARDLLPVSRGALESGLPSTKSARSRAADKRELNNDKRSLAAQIAATAPAALDLGIEVLRRTNFSALAPLLASDLVRQSVAAIAAIPARRRPEPTEPTGFWTSTSAVIQVRDSDLSSLGAAVPDIEDILPNRRMFVPPVAVPKSLPGAVEDSKISSWGVRRIGALAAWGALGARGRGVKIGLLDTGVDASHPDLNGKITDWAEFDDKGREVAGSRPHDSDRHGTHCAGTILGGNASGRWIGVAPEAEIAAALVLNGALGGTDAQILAGIDWAVNKGVDAISMSLGGFVLGPDVPPTYTKAILSALQVGIPVIAAIGNEGSQTSGTPGSDFLAFAVGATDPSDRAAGFSGGRTQIIRRSQLFPESMLPLVYSKPDVSAPGVAIYSSVPGGKWEHFNGTSMATPHVAGAIALLLSATRLQTVPAAQRAFVIQDLLTGSAEELGESGQNHRFGFGRIDILRTIGFAQEKGY